MKHLLLFAFILSSLLQLSLTPAQGAELVKVVKADKRDTVQIYFSFDSPPKFSITANQRRIDLIFKNTVAAPDLSFFPPDKHIVKILPRTGKAEYAVSLYFRYKPQKHKLSQSPDGKLVFEVLLGNEFSKSYQELAERLKGITVLDRLPSADPSNPAILSPYAKDWMSFFAGFETPVEIALPVAFTPPPFPIIRLLPSQADENFEVLDVEALEMAKKGHWNLLEEKLLGQVQTTTALDKQKMLALTLGETLFHKGDFRSAYIQLHLVKEQYREELVGIYANYLLACLRAVHESPNIADAEFQAMEASVKKTPLAPYFHLSLIDTALATGQLSRLNKLLLRDDIALPQPVVELVRIRQADYWHAAKQPLKAYASYQLHRKSPVLVTQPSSLGGYCNTLYSLKKYEEAAACYEILAPLVADKPLQGLVHFRKNMAKLKYHERLVPISEFARIENGYPETEAGYRAGMKKNDLTFLQSKEQAREVIAGYEAIAEKFPARSLREEALLKIAVVHAETGESAASIPLLQQILREFRSGDVRISAQALLIQLLPGEIKRLVESREYVKALVLAKQNRDLFQKNWIDSQLLVDTAEAYFRIGLYEEAQKLYLYLIEILPPEQLEKLYLPMVQAAFQEGNNSLVEDLVAQYTYNYPQGKYADQLITFRIEALVGDERLTEALNLLPAPLPDNNTELQRIAASLYFRLNDHKNCLTALKKLAELENPLPQKEQFLLAESLFATGAFAEAEKEFRLVSRENDFYDQSRFRLATLERQKGDEEKALSFLREIVEKGSNPRWKEYAERELQFSSVTSRKQRLP